MSISQNKIKIFVGMSGGVDSSVTAYLLKKQGYDVVGVFMRCYNLDGCAEQDAEDARRVAEHIGIPFYVWDFEEEYKRRVVEYMIDGYRAGITPNPDVMCNKEIKFGLFLEKALAMGADFVATGHYVQIKKNMSANTRKDFLVDTSQSRLKTASKNSTLYQLFAAKDKNKDQSYFLWTLTQKQLAYCLFPIGGYLKPEVRKIATRAGLPTAAKKDSQGICFLGNISIQDFLKEYIPERRGALVTTTGENIGEHFGAEFYTIGQRHIDAEFKFLKTGSRASNGVTKTNLIKTDGTKPIHIDRQAFYVASKDATTNTVVVAEGSTNEALYKKDIELTGVNWLAGMPDSGKSRKAQDETKAPIDVFARVRYRQPLSSAKISQLKNGTYKLEFKKPQKFVAQGQSAVWYSKQGEMLGGGVIL